MWCVQYTSNAAILIVARTQKRYDHAECNENLLLIQIELKCTSCECSFRVVALSVCPKNVNIYLEPCFDEKNPPEIVSNAELHATAAYGWWYWWYWIDILLYFPSGLKTVACKYISSEPLNCFCCSEYNWLLDRFLFFRNGPIVCPRAVFSLLTWTRRVTILVDILSMSKGKKTPRTNDWTILKIIHTNKDRSTGYMCVGVSARVF